MGRAGRGIVLVNVDKESGAVSQEIAGMPPFQTGAGEGWTTGLRALMSWPCRTTVTLLFLKPHQSFRVTSHTTAAYVSEGYYRFS
jgi:hypothetical protein